MLVYDASGKLVAEYSTTSTTNGRQYVFSDHQGSPRLITNSSGSVASRHDYAPFGEDLTAGIGMRASGQGYGAADSARQKYAGMESDDATGMAHTLWRQYDSFSGRWTSFDPYGGSMSIGNPQSFNRYSYVNNDPVNQVDPIGLAPASEGWSSASQNFWGGDPGFFDPHFGGPAIIQNGLEGFPDRRDEDNFILDGPVPYIAPGDDPSQQPDDAMPQNSADTKPADLETRVQAMANQHALYLNNLLNALGKDVESHDFDVLYKRVPTIEVNDAPLIKAGEPDAAGLAEGDSKNRRIYIHHDYHAAANHQEARWNKITAIVIFELLHHARHKGKYDDAALDAAVISLMSPSDQKAANQRRHDPKVKYRNGSIAGESFRNEFRY